MHLKHVWIKPDGTPLVTAGPDQVGRAALHGGTTTLIDFAYWREGQSALQAIESRDKDFVGSSPCDWAYHIMLHSEPPPEFAGQLAETIQHVVKEECQPDAFPAAVDADKIHSVVPIATAHQRQTMFAEPKTIFDRPNAVFVQGQRFARGARQIVISFFFRL